MKGCYGRDLLGMRVKVKSKWKTFGQSLNALCQSHGESSVSDIFRGNIDIVQLFYVNFDDENI